MVRSKDVEVISDVNRKAYRRQLHRLVRWLGWHGLAQETVTHAEYTVVQQVCATNAQPAGRHHKD